MKKILKIILNKKSEILLLLITCIIMLFIFEIGLRLFWSEPVYGKYGYPDGLHIPDDTKGFKYRPNFSGFFPNYPYNNIEIQINSKGLRDFEHDYDKQDGVIRILGLGDSVTFGAGVKFEDTYLAQLEKKLIGAGHEAEIIKAGVNSYEFSQIKTYYYEEGYKYNPDIVIYGFVLRDIRTINVSFLENEYLKRQQKYNSNSIGFIENKNYCTFCRFLKSFLTYRNVTSELKQREKYNQIFSNHVLSLWNNTEYDDFENEFLLFNEKLKENDVKLILLIYPYTEQFINVSTSPQQKLKKLANLNEISYIDLMDYINFENFEDYYLGGDHVHLNSAGYRIVSNLLFDKLNDEKLLFSNDLKIDDNDIII